MSTDIKLPKDWKWTKLGDSVLIQDNLRKPINTSERQKRTAGKTEKDLYPYYGATGQVGWIDSFITNGEYILVGEDGAPFLDNFKEKAYKIVGKTWVNNHAHVLKEKDNLSINDFILHYLNSINYRQYVNGTTRLKLTKSSLVEIPFPLPPLSTQQAIVSKIEELFSELDNGIANLKTAQQQLKTYRQSVLKWAFEDISLIKFDEVISSSQNGISKRSGTVGSNFKVLRLADITNSKIDYSSPREIIMNNQEIEKYKLFENDLICIRVNGSKDLVGKLVYVTKNNENDNWAFCDHFIRFRLNELALSKFYYNYFQTTLARKYIQDNMVASAGQNTVSQVTIKDMLVPFCDIAKQSIIIQEIESRLSVADKMEESINQSLQQAEALRQSILKKAFSGELLPSSPTLLLAEKGELNAQPVLSPSPRGRGTKGEGTTPSNT